MKLVKDEPIPERQQWLYDAIEAVCRAYDEFRDSRSPVEAAYAITSLNDRVSDLRTYHPGYDIEDGTMPYDRETE